MEKRYVVCNLSPYHGYSFLNRGNSIGYVIDGFLYDKCQAQIRQMEQLDVDAHVHFSS